ncbi:hypothetical protein FB451DRAFT_1207232 [Mycena latifolia]|nr:hypothetical protein FB451DRAFT_1207232 [Mycena latifolia]
MSTYSVTDYLLDRANIRDVITRMAWYVDRQEWDLLSGGFTDELVMDYTELFGGEPAHLTNTAQAQVWKGMLGYLDATIHVFTGVLVDLPQPGAIGPPTEASCTCNGLVALRRNAAHGDPLTQSGAYYTFKLKKVASATGNPWRVSLMEAHLTYMKGNADVTKNPETNVGWM